jgi:hypothetical protein
MISKSGRDLFTVGNNDIDWKVVNYLHDWCELAETNDFTSSNIEIGSKLNLLEEWKNIGTYSPSQTSRTKGYSING